MEQKQYIVIGGSRGIGLQITKDLLSQNHKVTVLSRGTEQLPQDANLTHIVKDILVDELATGELPGVIDGLVYCPGSIVLKPFKSLSEEQFMDDYKINVLGAVKSIKAAINGLKASTNEPSIVLFSTVAVGQGMPFHASIAASKGAVEGLTRSLAAELSPTIRVNCIAPSLTDTELASKILSSPEKSEAAAQRHPLKKIGKVEDISAMATFLLSSQSQWITGQIMHIDGGMSSLKV